MEILLYMADNAVHCDSKRRGMNFVTTLQQDLKMFMFDICYCIILRI